MKNKYNLVFFFTFLVVAALCYFTDQKTEGIWFLLIAHMLQGDT